MWDASAPVVVGIDGSRAAINAARWAIDEAMTRDVALRFVHAIEAKDYADHPHDTFQLEIQYAEESLRSAVAAVKVTGKLVKVETDVVWGPIEHVLLEESRNASLICVGSTGVGSLASELLGSTAAAMAEKAFCPVAVIRAPRRLPNSQHGWIVVVVEDHGDNEKVIEHAMNEARLRRSPVLAVGVRSPHGNAYARIDALKRLDEWEKRYPDIHVHAVRTRGSVAQFLADTKDRSVELVVVGAADAGSIADIVGPHCLGFIPHSQCSALVVH